VVDWILKSARLGALAVLLIAIAINPWLGAAVSVVYALLALLIAGWSFRLMIFGAVFTGDFMTMRWRREKVRSDQVAVFSDSGLDGVPVRTWGRVSPDGAGGVVFRFRKLPTFTVKEIPIRAPLFVGRGLVSP